MSGAAQITAYAATTGLCWASARYDARFDRHSWWRVWIGNRATNYMRLIGTIHALAGLGTALIMGLGPHWPNVTTWKQAAGATLIWTGAALALIRADWSAGDLDVTTQPRNIVRTITRRQRAALLDELGARLNPTIELATRNRDTAQHVLGALRTSAAARNDPSSTALRTSIDQLNATVRTRRTAAIDACLAGNISDVVRTALEELRITPSEANNIARNAPP